MSRLEDNIVEIKRQKYKTEKFMSKQLWLAVSDKAENYMEIDEPELTEPEDNKE